MLYNSNQLRPGCYPHRQFREYSPTPGVCEWLCTRLSVTSAAVCLLACAVLRCAPRPCLTLPRPRRCSAASWRPSQTAHCCRQRRLRRLAPVLPRRRQRRTLPLCWHAWLRDPVVGACPPCCAPPSAWIGRTARPWQQQRQQEEEELRPQLLLLTAPRRRLRHGQAVLSRGGCGPAAGLLPRCCQQERRRVGGLTGESRTT